MRRVIQAILLFFSLQATSQTIGFTLDQGKHSVSVPIEIHNNLVIVPVVVNGVLPLKFIVDTGVRTTILTQKIYADLISLPYTRKFTIKGLGETKLIDAFVSPNVTLKLPGVTGTGHAILVLDEDYLQLQKYLGINVQGILGYEIFSRFVVEFDYDKKILILTDPHYFKPTRRHRYMNLTIEDTKPFIKTTLVQSNGSSISAKLLVDSGAGNSLLLDPRSDSTISIPEKNISLIIGRGIGGEINGKIGKISAITIAGFKLENVPANFPDDTSYMDSLYLNFTFRNGSIGGEILSRFNVIFDFAGEKIYLQKGKDFKKKYYYNISGINLIASGTDFKDILISSIQPGSPSYESGLQEGDKVFAVNRIKTAGLDMNTISHLINGRAEKKISIDIIRNGVKHNVRFFLTDPL